MRGSVVERKYTLLRLVLCTHIKGGNICRPTHTAPLVLAGTQTQQHLLAD